MSQQAAAPIDYTLTHRVRRTSSGAPNPLRLFFNVLGRSLDFAPAEEGGSPQDVCAAVAKGIAGDNSLAPHFAVEPIPTAAAPAGGPAVAPAAEESGAAASRSSRPRRTEPTK